MENLIKDIYYQIKDLVRRVAYLEAHDGVSDLSSAMSFVQLTDTPNDYVGDGGKVVAVKGTEDGLEFVVGGTGVDTFLELADTPSSYSGQANKIVLVNGSETALEFVTFSPESSCCSPLTNGDPDNPELIFSDGDVIMVPGV